MMIATPASMVWGTLPLLLCAAAIMAITPHDNVHGRRAILVLIGLNVTALGFYAILHKAPIWWLIFVANLVLCLATFGAIVSNVRRAKGS